MTHKSARMMPGGTISCGFTCQAGRIQKGHDMAHSKEASRPNCAKKCCMTKGCIGFDFDTVSKDCWLSKTPWSKVPPTGGVLAMNKMTCTRKNGASRESRSKDNLALEEERLALAHERSERGLGNDNGKYFDPLSSYQGAGFTLYEGALPEGYNCEWVRWFSRGTPSAEMAERGDIPSLDFPTVGYLHQTGCAPGYIHWERDLTNEREVIIHNVDDIQTCADRCTEHRWNCQHTPPGPGPYQGGTPNDSVFWGVHRTTPEGQSALPCIAFEYGRRGNRKCKLKMDYNKNRGTMQNVNWDSCIFDIFAAAIHLFPESMGLGLPADYNGGRSQANADRIESTVPTRCVAAGWGSFFNIAHALAGLHSSLAGLAGCPNLGTG